MIMLLALAAAALPQTAPQAKPQTAPAASTAPAATPKYTLETPIETLAANEATKAVLNADLPGLLEIPQYEMIKGLSLTQLQPYSGGKLTDELLAKTAADLAKIP
jgi:hypothetical protein